MDTDTLRLIGLSDDPLLQNKLKENVELAEAASRALEHIYEEEPASPLPPPVVEEPSSPKSNFATAALENASTSMSNGTEPVPSLSPTTLNGNRSATSSPSVAASTNNNDETVLLSTVPPPPPPPPTSSASTSPNTLAPASAVATTLPLAHSAAAIQAAYRHSSLLGALPTGAAIRAPSGVVYATAAGLGNGMTSPVIYGGKTISFFFYCLKEKVLFDVVYNAFSMQTKNIFKSF